MDSLMRSEWLKSLGVTMLVLIFLLVTFSAIAEEPSAPVIPPMELEFNETYYQKMNVLTVDTRDTAACRQVAKDLYDLKRISASQYDNFCYQSDDEPLVSVFIPDSRKKDGVHIRFSDLSKREQTLVRQTRNMSVVALGVIGSLFLVPESAQGWDEDQMDDLGQKYIDHVNTRPEWDTNAWYYNYIGHPISGAAYYQVARHAGFSRGESFAYSVFMSTVFWEYGFEAPFEVPSIQDLIITPVVGSLLGEFFYQQSKKIRENGGTVLGSKGLGNVAMTLMDPAGSMLDSVNDLFREDIFVDSEAFFSSGKNPYTNKGEIRFGIRFLF